MLRLTELFNVAAEVFFEEVSQAARVQCGSIAARAAAGQPNLDLEVWRVLMEDGARPLQFDRARAFIQLTTGLSLGFRKWILEQASDFLLVAPAQELSLPYDGQYELRDWRSEWAVSGALFYGPKMAALKTDPIWKHLSAFGLPWPPFEVGSRAGVANLIHSEAVRIGLLRSEFSPATRQSFKINLCEFRHRLSSSLKRWESASSLSTADPPRPVP
ncbi:MAG TPA: hypothetical protein VN673_16165 [Clostridia bacterium]|nr:hypothetical protein [Clostridia bacterium]